MPEFAISSRVVLALFVSKPAASSLSEARPDLAVIEKQTGATGFDAEDGNPPGDYRLPATTERPASVGATDPAARKVIRNCDVMGKRPHMLFPLPGGEWAFVSYLEPVLDLSKGGGPDPAIPLENQLAVYEEGIAPCETY